MALASAVNPALLYSWLAKRAREAGSPAIMARLVPDAIRPPITASSSQFLRIRNVALKTLDQPFIGMLRTFLLSSINDHHYHTCKHCHAFCI